MQAEVISQSRFQEVSPSYIPSNVVEMLLKRASRFTSTPMSSLAGFNKLVMLSHNDGYQAYFGEYTSVYDFSSGETESRTDLLEYSGTGDLAGLGEIRLSISNQEKFFKDKPFVGMTHTLESLRGRGLGRRRLFSMNAASILLHGHNLHSSDLISPEAKRLWKVLEIQNHAESYAENKYCTRYRFL